MNISCGTPSDRRIHGRELACVAILRSHFYQRRGAAGRRAIQQLRGGTRLAQLKEDTGGRGFRFLMSVAAAIVLVLAIVGAYKLLIQSNSVERWEQVAGYPAPNATGEFSIVGNQSVGRGVRLVTGDGHADLALGGYCDLAVGPNSMVLIEGRKMKEAIFLEKGHARCLVKPGLGEFKVRSDLGTVIVTEAELEVRLLRKGETTNERDTETRSPGPAGRRLLVKVLTGAALVASPDGEIHLRAGDVRILPHGPALPRTVDKLLEVHLEVPDITWTVQIEEVYHVGDELWVVSRLQQGFAIASMRPRATVRDSVNLNVPDLPVKHFILGKTWNWGNREPHVFADSMKRYEARLATGNCIYRKPG